MDSAALAPARDLIAYIDESPTPFHACQAAARRLEAAGFTRVEETDHWPEPAGAEQRHYFVRDGSLVAWATPPHAAPTTPFRIVGAHTDSPNLRLKPHPDVESAGMRALAVEVYGGALFNSWLDRDLALAGRVALRDRRVELVAIDRPIARIPQLAIHLDRDVNTKGLVLNPQQHLVPVWDVAGADSMPFRDFLAAELDREADEIVFWDLMFHAVEPSAIIGRDDVLVSAPRLDNLASCWAAIEGLTAEAPSDGLIAVVVLFDHEEIGSTTNRGASSSILDTTLERVTRTLGGDRDDWQRALAASYCASADMAHATHPNYPERHEPGHQIAFGGGPVVKTNASQRYATDARSAAAFIESCERVGVPMQHYVHRNDLPCGSTIGPITAARLGVPTVDVGSPQLSMHAARELMATADVDPYRKALGAFLH